MRKRYLWIVLTLIAVLVLAGCGQEATRGPYEITDSTGHTESFEELPENIVIAGKATVMVQDTVFLFPEALQKVKAVENRKQSLYVFLPLVDSMIDVKAKLEMNAGAEQIAALNPDLVIMKNFLAESMGAPLGELDIPVLYMDLETPEAFYTDVAVLGQVFGNTERAEEITSYYKEREEMVSSKTANLSADAKPDVLLLKYDASGEEIAFQVAPAAYLQTTMVQLAGGNPIWTEASEAGGWTVVSIEQIASWDPDQIYIIDYSGGGSDVVASLYANDLWAELSAVQNGELYAFAFDYYSWDQPDTRWILGLEWLATKIQPELFSDLDILAETASFYSELYDVESANYEAQVVPLFSGDLP